MANSISGDHRLVSNAARRASTPLLAQKEGAPRERRCATVSASSDARHVCQATISWTWSADTVVNTAIEQRHLVPLKMQSAVLQSSPLRHFEIHIHGLVAAHYHLVSNRVGGLPPYIIIWLRSLRPYDFELKFAFVVFAVVAKHAQDTVLRARRVSSADTTPVLRLLVGASSLAEEQLPLQTCDMDRGYELE